METLSFRTLFSVLAVSIVSSACCTNQCAQETPSSHGWPIDPPGQTRSIGNSIAEFMNYDGLRLHAGIDILAPDRGHSNAPSVIATTSGRLRCEQDFCIVEGDNGLVYQYVHIHFQDFPEVVILSNNGGEIRAGERLGQINVFLQEPHFSHLHYQVECGDVYLDPLQGMTPKTDSFQPVVQSIGFAKNKNAGDDSGWDEFAGRNGNACGGEVTVVSGSVDIIAKVIDRFEVPNESGCGPDSTIGIRQIRWAVCPMDNPNCNEWKGHLLFDKMPKSWHDRDDPAPAAIFSRASPFESEFGYCREDPSFMVVTNSKDGKPDPAGFWDTTKWRNGIYSVSVEAVDYFNLEGRLDQPVCVQN